MRNDGTVDPLTGDGLAAANLAAMGPLDDIALVFASFIVAFTVVGELKDIELCSMAVAHAGDKLSKGWRLALGFLLWMRRWVFLPALVMDVPMLVLLKGGDALSVCLNTVAILFMCDVDNIAFDLALGERVRARVEDAGRVELDDAEATALARTKAVHVALIVLAVLGAVFLGQGRPEATIFLPLRACGLGGGAAGAAPTVQQPLRHAHDCLVRAVSAHGSALLCTPAQPPPRPELRAEFARRDGPAAAPPRPRAAFPRARGQIHAGARAWRAAGPQYALCARGLPQRWCLAGRRPERLVGRAREQR